MNTDMKTHVISLLESYRKRERQISLLHYEIQHSARISPEEMIDSMSLGHGARRVIVVKDIFPTRPCTLP